MMPNNSNKKTISAKHHNANWGRIMKTGKISSRAALYPAAAISLVLLSQQSFAAVPTTGSFDQWSVTSGTISATCPTGYTCGTAVTGDGFFQRQIVDTTSGGKTYFQTIITDTGATATSANLGEVFFVEQPAAPVVDEPAVVSLNCPEGFICGDVIVGDGFLPQELTDGNYFWFQTAITNSNTIKFSPGGLSTPLRLFHIQPNLALKPGTHLVAAAGAALADRLANLHLNRDQMSPADPDYTDVNQQSEDAQKIYRQVVDAEITGLSTGTEANLTAQLNVPLEIPNGHAIHLRVLTAQGWTDFVSDDHNHVLTATKLDTGFCPAPDSDLFKDDIGAGSECVQFTVQDGGPNDGDGKADGSVALTTGVILKAVEVSATPAVTQAIDSTGNSEGAGGGGIWPWWLSLAAAGMLFGHNRRQRDAA
jgi:hypothetical protein